MLSGNAPSKQFSAGVLHFRGPFAGALRYRWADEFFWFNGIYNSPIRSYSVVDLNFRYALSPRMALGADIANLLGSKHYEIFGGSLLDRRALAHLEVSW